MSARKELPWNMKPKNGIKVFFTEEKFRQWIGTEDHSTKMNDRLKKLGISLSSAVPPGSWFLPGTEISSAINERTSDEKKEGLLTEHKGDGIGSTRMDKRQSSDISLKNSGESCSQMTESSYRQSVELQTHPPEVPKRKFNVRKDPETCHTRVEMHKAQLHVSATVPYAVDQGLSHTGGDNEGNAENKINVTHAEDAGQTDDSDRQILTDVEARQEDLPGTLAPVSFYRESAEVAEEQTPMDPTVSNSVEAVESKNDEASSSALHTHAKSDHVISQKLWAERRQSGDMSDVIESHARKGDRSSLQGYEGNRKGTVGEATDPTETDRKAIKNIMMADKMFYNIRDRTAEKYIPQVYGKRPRNRFSALTSHEHKVYLDLHHRYGNIVQPTEEILNDPAFKRYVKMKVQVDREQELYQKYLHSVAQACKNDYHYIHPEVEKYVTARSIVKRKDWLQYPRFYQFIERVFLSDDSTAGCDKPLTLQYVRPLLELGRVNKLVMPVMLPGMPQPCVATSFKRINELSPVVKNIYKGIVWKVYNKVVCSQDINAEQLAVPNKCDIVMSSSAIKNLVDNQGPNTKCWDMPVTVREYQIREGEQTVTHKVVYIDKPVIRPSQYVPKDRIQVYQKYAIRASSTRLNVRGHVFCGIKPSHELIKTQELEEIEQELTDYEKILKETMSKTPVYEESEKEPEDAENPMRKKTGGKKKGKSQVGMFVVEEGIDDLESFGTENLFKMPIKSKLSTGKVDEVTQKGHNEEKIKTGLEESKKQGAKNKRKSDEDDLEFLKHELQGIKTRAIRESYKHADVYREASLVSKEKTTSVHQQDGKESEASGKSDNIACRNVNDLTENADHTKHELHETLNTGEHKSFSTASSEDKTERAEKKGFLSVKNLSTVSEKMKQMSKIQLKLQKREIGKEIVLSDWTLEHMASAGGRTTTSTVCLSEGSSVDRTSNKQQESVASENAEFISNETKPDSFATETLESKEFLTSKELKSFESKEPDLAGSSVSDVVECEELVIDLPDDSVPSLKRQSSQTQQVAKGGNVSDIEMPELEKEIPSDRNDKAPATLNLAGVGLKELEPPALSDSEMGSPKLVIADAAQDSPIQTRRGARMKKDISSKKESTTDEMIVRNTSDLKGVKSISQKDSVSEEKEAPPTSAKDTVGGSLSCQTRTLKRRSTGDIAQDIPVNKKSLRSLKSQELSVGSCNEREPHDVEEAQTVLDDTKGERIQSSIASEKTDKDSTVEQPQRLRRGRKSKAAAEQQADDGARSTRSRSRSLEGPASQPVTRRVTRQSVGTSKTVEVKTELNQEESPAKRKRGRQAKKHMDIKKDTTEDRENPFRPAADKQESETEDLEKAILDCNKITEEAESKSDVEMNDGNDSVNSESIDSFDSLCRKRSKKTKQLQIDSDSEEEVSKNKSSHDKLKGKKSSSTKKVEHKKEHDVEEAKKIREMAEAMKKRIGEKQIKEKSQQEFSHSEDLKDKPQSKNVDGSSQHPEFASKMSATPKPGHSNSGYIPKTLNSALSSSDASQKAKVMLPVEVGGQIQHSVVKSVGEKGDNQGIDSLLSSQGALLAENRYKGTNPAEFTATHGMSQCAFPVEDNVTYHQWNLGVINILIRCKYHGFISGQGLVHIVPKLEYQPTFGFEQDTLNETARNWISIYVRPNSSLVKAHVNPFNSEIMMLEYLGYPDLIPVDSSFSPSKAFSGLHTVLQKLKRLPVGQYLLKNNPKKNMYNIYTAASEDSGEYDLHLQTSSILKWSTPNPVQWTPLNTRMMLPHQRKMSLIPCTYQPKDAVMPVKNTPKKKRKKKSAKGTDKDAQ